MQEIKTIEELREEIESKEPVLIYFSGENCSVCKVLKPKIEEEVQKNFPKMKIFEVKTDESLELTAQFMIFSIPATIIYFDAKEFKRYGRNMSIPLFIEELKRPYSLMCE